MSNSQQRIDSFKIKIMGKYPNSEIHAKYSDWHWKLREIDPKYARLYQSDIDRLWCEYSYNCKAVVAVIDLKYSDSDDGMTSTEKGVYEWFESKGAKFYIVFVNRDFTIFKVQDSKNEIMIFNSIEYADWLLSLRTIKYKEQFNIPFKTVI